MDRKLENIERKEESITQKEQAIINRQKELELVIAKQMEELERISGYTAEEAKRSCSPIPKRSSTRGFRDD